MKTKEENAESEEQTTTFIDLTKDYGFKIVMADEAHPELMIGLLNGVIPERRVVHIDFLNKEIIGSYESDKRLNYDVLCVDKDGNRFLVEMQKCSYDYFADRLVAYSGDQLMHLLRRGEDYSQIRRSYIISVLGELLRLSDEDEPFTRQVMRTAYITMSDSKISLSNKLKFIFLQLPMAVKPAEDASFIEKWTYYVREMHAFRDKPSGLDPYFDLLFESSRRSNIESGKLSIYDKMERDEVQIRAEIAYAARKSREEGLAEGLANGESKAKLETAVRLKAAGVSLDTIVQCTGLPFDVVLDL